MAFVLGRGSRALGVINQLSNQARRTWATKSRYSFSNFTHIDRIHRPISYLHNALFSTNTASLVVENARVPPVVQGEVELGIKEENNNRKSSGKFSYKDRLMKYMNNIVSGDEPVVNSRHAFIFLKSCGRGMVNESNSTRTELLNHVWDELDRYGVKKDTSLWNTLLSTHIENRHDVDTLHFIKNMWEVSNAEPNRTTFILLQKSYALRGDNTGAMKMVEFMMQNGGYLTESMYAWMIYAFAINGETDGINEIFDSMKSGGVDPGQKTYGLLINAYAERGDLVNIDKTIDEMVNKGLRPTYLNYLDMLEHLAMGDHHEVIDRAMERIGDIDGLYYDIWAIIRRCVANDHYESALKLILSSTKKTGDGYMYYIGNVLFKHLLYARKDFDEYKKILYLLDQHFGTFFNKNNLLNFFVSNGKHEHADNMLRSMLSEGMAVYPLSFDPILQYYAEEKMISKLVGLIKCLMDSGIYLSQTSLEKIASVLGTPMSDEYNLFFQEIKGYDKAVLPHGSISRLCETDNFDLKMLNDAVSISSNADVFKSWRYIKDQLLSKFDTTGAITLVSNLVKRGAKIQNYIGQIIDEKSTDKDCAKEVLQFVIGLVEEGIDIGSRNYTRMLSCLSYYNFPEEFFSFVRLMKEHGVEPDEHQYFHMLRVSSKTGNSIGAQYCFDKLIDADDVDKRPKMDFLYQLLILAYCHEKRSEEHLEEEQAYKITTLFNEMVARGLEPTHLTKATVIHTLFKVGDVDGAEKIIKQYALSSDDLGFRTSSYYIGVQISCKEYMKAEQLFQEAKDESPLQLRHYNEIMKMCVDTGDTAKVEAYYQDLLGSGITPNGITETRRIGTYLMAEKPEICVDIIENYIAKGKKDVKLGILLTVLKKLQFTGNIKYVSKLISMIEECYPLSVNESVFDSYLILTLIKAGKFEEASSILSRESDSRDQLHMVTYLKKAAMRAAEKADINHIDNIIKFLDMNGIKYPQFDMFYLQALDRTDNVERIQSFYKECIEQTVPLSPAFLDLLDGIIKKRDIPNFLVK